MHVPVFAEICIHNLDDARGDGEAETFASPAFCQNEGIQSHHVAVEIDQCATTVSGIDWCICLYVNHPLVGIQLAPGGTDHTHGDRILQSLWTTHS